MAPLLQRAALHLVDYVVFVFACEHNFFFWRGGRGACIPGRRLEWDGGDSWGGHPVLLSNYRISSIGYQPEESREFRALSCEAAFGSWGFESLLTNPMCCVLVVERTWTRWARFV